MMLLAALYPQAHILNTLYLAPLARCGVGGAAQRATLDAYFSAGLNVSSTASKLRLHRNTVRDRLKAVENVLGRPLHSCLAEVMVALALERLTSQAPAGERDS